MRYAHLTDERKRVAVEGISTLINEGERHKNVTIGKFGGKRGNDNDEKTASLLG